MMDRRKRLGSLALTLALVGLNLLALNYLLAGWSSARIDLTEDDLYSLSPATKKILSSLEEELTIYGYFSERTHPKLAPLVPEIADLLDEYRALSRGRVRVELIDPGEDEEIEQEAAERFGVRSVPFQFASKYETGIVNAYFSLVVRYGDRYERYGFEDLIEIEATPDGDVDVRLRNLEYDLTRAIKKVSSSFRGSLELFEALEEPVTLTAIMSPESLPEVFSEVPEAVRRAAEELEQKGGEGFLYEEIDPTTDPAQEEEVYRRFGARPMALGLLGDESFYLYLILESGERSEQILLTGGELSAADIREAVGQSLRRRIPGFRKTVGLVAPDPSLPPELAMQYQMQGMPPPTPPPEFEELRRQLEQDYDVRSVRLDGDGGVPYEIDVLLLLKPRQLDQTELFHLDQYLMRGGRVLIGTGNYDVEFGQAGLRLTPAETGLGEWLGHFGISIPQTLVLDDRNQPLPIPETRRTAFGNIRTWVMAPYPYLIQVRDEGLVNRDVAATLDAVGIYWGSPVIVDEERAGELQVETILRSSERSWTSDDLSAASYVDYEVPGEGTEPRALAVALSGRFESYFADREPPSSEPAEEEDGDGTGEAASPPPAVTLERSPETRLVVIGDSEFLSDFVARALDRLEGGFFPENLRFMKNLVDWSTLDNEMIAIRSHGLAGRRLSQPGPAGQRALEWGNYAVVAAILIGLGAWRYWRRRNAHPLFPSGRTRAVAAGPSGREV